MHAQKPLPTGGNLNRGETTKWNLTSQESLHRSRERFSSLLLSAYNLGYYCSGMNNEISLFWHHLSWKSVTCTAPFLRVILACVCPSPGLFLIEEAAWHNGKRLWNKWTWVHMAALPFKPEDPAKALTLSEPFFPQLFLRGRM